MTNRAILPRLFICGLALVLTSVEPVAAPDEARTRFQKDWLEDQILGAKSPSNPEIERDAFRRLLSMEPADREVQLDLLRRLVRNEESDPEETAVLIRKLCADPVASVCREARTLESVFLGGLAQPYASVRMLSVAGRNLEAASAMERLFNGPPAETSLRYEYALLLVATAERRTEGLQLLREISQSPSPLVSREARVRLRTITFEEELEQALDGAYDDATRERSVRALERILAEHPDDPRTDRWRNALTEGRYWLAVDRGDAMLRRRALQKAEKAYREAVRLAPERPYAYVGLADIAEARGSQTATFRYVKKALSVTDLNRQSYRTMLQNRLRRMTLASLRNRTAKLQPANNENGDYLERPSDAYVSALKAELALSGPDPWRIAELARAHWARDEKVLAEDVWSKRPKTFETEEARNQFLYAEALFWRGVDHPERALAVLAPFVPLRNETERDAWLPLAATPAEETLTSLQNLAVELQRDLTLATADRLANDGRYSEALHVLLSVDALPSWRLAKGADWAEQAGRYETAWELWTKTGRAPSWYAESVFGRLRALAALRPTDLRARTTSIVRELETRLTEEKKLDANLLQRMSSHLDDVGAEDEAVALLLRHTELLTTPNDETTLMLWRRVAMAHEESGRSDEALDAYRKAFSLAGFLQDEAGRPVSFTRGMRLPDVPEPPEGANEPAAMAPNGWLSLSLRKRAADLYLREQTVFCSGLDFKLDPGTKGYSDLTALTWMNEVSLPAFDGRATVRTDSVGVRMGSLGGGYQSFGTLRAWDAGSASAGDPINKDWGQSFAFRWVGEQLDFDIGTTPVGFHYVSPSGAVNWSWDVGDFGLSVGAYYRPEDGSLLAFGGQRDPNTGRTWGGVRRQGLRFGASHDLGEKDGYWFESQFESLHGHNVADNTALRLMGGWYRRLVDRPRRETTVGASILYWHYDKDLSDYYFGQGGYYSPNHALSIGGFLEEARRHDDWSWVLRGRLGMSWSKSDERDRYPLKGTLQPYGLPDLYAVEEKESSFGFGAALSGTVEHRLSKRSFVGAAFSYQHDTDEYTPFYLGLWYRWHFTDWEGDLALPPEPMLPYSEW